MEIDFEELVHRQVESDTLDYKAHQSWSEMSAAARGKFIRHLAAFANTDGGFLVVGVGEDASGCACEYTGLTEEEARSFDPSAVGGYVNRCVDPPIDFTLERPVVRGKRYAIFVVRPFSSLPHVCSRGVENELQTGVFYIRTKDASSRPAHRAMEMHRLIQRALRNQRELLGKMLRGILYESGIQDQPESAGGAAEESADDIFASGVAYFRRRRSPCPGEPGVMLQFAVSDGAVPTLPPERIRAAGMAAAAANGGFITLDKLQGAHPGNVSWRYLSENSPLMFQLFRCGWIHFVEFVHAPFSGMAVAEFEDKFTDLCFFVGRYYRELGEEKSLLNLRFELSGLSGALLRTDTERFAARTPHVECSIVRSASDIGCDVSGYAGRLLRALGEGFGLPDSVLMESGRRISVRLEELSR